MNKVAVFGNAGAGKSTLSKRLSEITGLPLIALDRIQYKPGGEKVSHTDYKAAHDQLLQQEQWIIDGFGSLDTVWKRLEAADTLVYLDMSLLRHYWWVTKRSVTSFWQLPEGWPENSPRLQSALNSYRTVRLCLTKLTPQYRAYVAKAHATKHVYHLRSPQEITTFYKTVEAENTNKTTTK